MLTPHEVLTLLERRHIPYTLYHHKAVFSGNDDLSFPKMKGEILKNLVLVNKKKELYMFSLPLYEKADLKAVAQKVASPRFSFCSKSDLAFMGTPAGMVSPLSLLNDAGGMVSFLLPDTLRPDLLVNCHPLKNTMSIDVLLGDLMELLQQYRHEACFLDNVLKKDDQH